MENNVIVSLKAYSVTGDYFKNKYMLTFTSKVNEEVVHIWRRIEKGLIVRLAAFHRLLQSLLDPLNVAFLSIQRNSVFHFISIEQRILNNMVILIRVRFFFIVRIITTVFKKPHEMYLAQRASVPPIFFDLMLMYETVIQKKWEPLD